MSHVIRGEYLISIKDEIKSNLANKQANKQADKLDVYCGIEYNGGSYRLYIQADLNDKHVRLPLHEVGGLTLLQFKMEFTELCVEYFKS